MKTYHSYEQAEFCNNIGTEGGSEAAQHARTSVHNTYLLTCTVTQLLLLGPCFERVCVREEKKKKEKEKRAAGEHERGCIDRIGHAVK